MRPDQQKLGLTIIDDDLDSEEIDQLAQQLRVELLESDADSVDFVSVGEAPLGTRAIDIAALGGLLVTVSESIEALSTVIDTVRRWLSRRGRGSVKLQIGDDILELSSVSKAREDQIVNAFLARHAMS
jgi:hypothetical protein